MRSKLKFGTSADDKTGDLLQEGARLIEDAFAEIYFFLSGGASEVKLPDTLPVSRGGTGVINDTLLGSVVVKNGSASMGLSAVLGVPQALITLTTNGANTYQFDGGTNIKSIRYTGYSFTITGLGSEVIDESSVAIPKDVNGNPLVAVHVVHDSVSKSYTVTVYEVAYEGGRVVPNMLVPKDIPEGSCIRLLLVRKIAP